MESFYFINLRFIFVLFFSGFCLNSVVIISFWRSVQLRKKLCHFMIMVLSCCDLLAVVTNNPVMAVIAMLFVTGNLDKNAEWAHIMSGSTIIFQACSLLALLVMNFDRYLATSYPLFHRTSVTKKRLLTLFAILVIIEATLLAISVNDAVISYQLGILIFIVLVSPPMLFLNYKLLLVLRKNRRGNLRTTAERKKSYSLKNISSCLLAFACHVTLISIPTLVYVVLKMNSNDRTSILDSSNINGYWGLTIASMNSTLNCLIFFWKNKVLRTEGRNVLKSLI